MASHRSAASCGYSADVRRKSSNPVPRRSLVKFGTDRSQWSDVFRNGVGSRAGIPTTLEEVRAGGEKYWTAKHGRELEAGDESRPALPLTT